MTTARPLTPAFGTPEMAEVRSGAWLVSSGVGTAATEIRTIQLDGESLWFAADGLDLRASWAD